jgi:hypothetical protein
VTIEPSGCNGDDGATTGLSHHWQDSLDDVKKTIEFMIDGAMPLCVIDITDKGHGDVRTGGKN